MTDLGDKKRKQPPENQRDSAQNHKKSKGGYNWHKSQRNPASFSQAAAILPGDSGVFATCNRNKEPKCIGELKDLFEDYSERLYSHGHEGEVQSRKGGDIDIDIEAELKDELADMQKPTQRALLQNVHLDVQCVVFLKTQTPIEPVSFVQAICEDVAHARVKRTRFIQRLTPMSVMGKATEAGLQETAMTALSAQFHDESKPSRKFAIKTNIRNHNKILTREKIITNVANLVGPRHKVDLTDYDDLILVEVYKNICGISVVGKKYDELRRFNLAELFDANSKPSIKNETSRGSTNS